ncbi:hypothetical protein SORDD17_00689 [Streptococcus oralis]|uniref:Uncharacterized protein n=1 Tax=Streptococcus oralis TaxID=1303 RepID=A0A139RMY5_STROR|nr:hypothetical protein SORDD17_00689 [Streptococcus oralis]
MTASSPPVLRWNKEVKGVDNLVLILQERLKDKTIVFDNFFID